MTSGTVNMKMYACSRARVVLALSAILGLEAAADENYTKQYYTDSECTNYDTDFGNFAYKYIGGNCYQYVDVNGGSFLLEQKSEDQVIGFDFLDDSCSDWPDWSSVEAVYEFSWSSWSAGDCYQVTWASFFVEEWGLSLNISSSVPTTNRLDRPLDAAHFPSWKVSKPAKTMYTAWNCTVDWPLWRFRHVSGDCYEYVTASGSNADARSFMSFTMTCEGTDVLMVDYSSTDCSGQPTGGQYEQPWQEFTTPDSCYTYSSTFNSSEPGYASEKFYMPLRLEDYPPACTRRRDDDVSSAPSVSQASFLIPLAFLFMPL